jgi:hypothetical protein
MLLMLAMEFVPAIITFDNITSKRSTTFMRKAAGEDWPLKTLSIC